MKGYQSVHPQFWRDVKVRAWTEDVRMLAVYLLTCEARLTEGYFQLSLGTAADDLQWERGKVADCAKVLARDDFADWDTEAGVVFMPKALKHHPTSDRDANRIKGVLNQLERWQGVERLWERFLVTADHYAPALADALRERYSEGASEGRSRSRRRSAEKALEDGVRDGAAITTDKDKNSDNYF